MLPAHLRSYHFGGLLRHGSQKAWVDGLAEATPRYLSEQVVVSLWMRNHNSLLNIILTRCRYCGEDSCLRSAGKGSLAAAVQVGPLYAGTRRSRRSRSGSQRRRQQNAAAAGRSM